MLLKELGKTGEKIPAIGLGTWGIGGWTSPDYTRDEEHVNIIKKAIELGMWLIDTAEFYGAGHSEELVGKAIKDFSREEIFIVSKVWSTNLRHDDLIKAAERSLKRLNTTYIDLYLIHWPNPTVPLNETMRAMEKLVKSGKIRYIGVSNFDVELMEEARSVLKKEDLVANQVKYSILDKNASTEVLSYCNKEKITLMAYTPLEKGRVVSHPVITEIAQKHGKTPVQVSLNWLIQQDQVIAIPKTSNPDHLVEFLGALDWSLDNDDLEKISLIEF